MQSRFFSPAVILTLAASILLAYSNTFHSSFQFDDLPSIVKDKSLKDLGNISGILRNTRGITLATFALNHAVGGLDTFGYHAVNTAVHILNAALAYLFLLFTLKSSGADETRSRLISASSALIFALHPIQTQAVTYIVQRMESLSSLFYLLGLILLIKGSSAGRGAKRVALYSGVAASYILGFWSKETAITFPAAAFLYDLFFLSELSVKNTLKDRWPLYAALLVLLVLFAFITIRHTGGFGDVSEESTFVVKTGETGAEAHHDPGEGGAGFATGISPKHYLYTQFNVLVYYLTLLAYPANQNLDYDFPVSFSLFETPVASEGTALNIPIPPPIISLFILSLILGGAVYLLWRAKRTGSPAAKIASFFVFWFFIIVSPTSSFVPIVDVIYEHRVYLASLGFFVIFALCVEGLLRRIFRARPAPL